MQINEKHKIIVILGPTASGKSDLAVKIAKYIEKTTFKNRISKTKKLEAKTYFGGEIISADSRQVYKGLDIGSGKIAAKEMRGIYHYLLDVANPKKTFTASQFQKLGKSALKKIIKKNKIPIICGGTGLYIDSLIYNYPFPEIPPQPKLRQKLEKLTTEKLFEKLQKLDPRRAESVDKNNRPRLIRSLEIIIATGKPVPKIELFPDIAANNNIQRQDYDVLKIGIKKSSEELKKLIAKRLYKRLKIGMVEEVENLHKNGLSWKRLDDLGLEYRFISRYLRALISKKEMKNSIISESLKYSKRQMTWFKRDKNIVWIKNPKEAELIVEIFLN